MKKSYKPSDNTAQKYHGNHVIKLAFFVIALLFFGYCVPDRRSDNNETAADTIETALPPFDTNDSKPIINVYVENSGSMDAYVNGNTEFKGAIRDLLVLMEHHYGKENNIIINFINSKIRKTETLSDLSTFASNINQNWRVDGEDIGSSNLNNIFKMILNNTDKNTISILFSDCIYSIKGKNAEGLLTDEKSLTKAAFLGRWRQDSLSLATTIVKMNSKFNGIYYDKDNKKTSLNNEIRPYYIIVIGTNEVISDFNRKIPLSKDKIEGFDNKYIISSSTSEEPYYSILLSTENFGRFKASRRHSNKEYVHGIEDINLNTRNKGSNNQNFSFAFVANLSEIPVEPDYLTDINNYQTDNNNFSIKEIRLIEKDKINPTDWNRIHQGNPTHIFIIEAKGTAVSDLKVSLIKKMPKWVDSANILDDSNIKANLDKTFGIKYLIEGIAEAYEIIYPEDKTYAGFDLRIKK